MNYLVSRNGWFSYSRRVPNIFKEFDPREKVRIALNTQCKRTALKKACALNDETESYWQSLARANKKHSDERYKEIVKLSRQLGFTYIPCAVLSEGDLMELHTRIQFLKNKMNNETVVSAILGGEEQSGVLLSQALERFWEYAKPNLTDKNSDQQRKWKNPRKKAVNNFVKAVGDKDINTITHQDILTFRDWWMERMDEEEIKADTVNKDFTHLKGVLETVSTHDELNLNIETLFKKIHLKEHKINQRASYTTEFIRDEILNPITLKQLDGEARSLLYILANIGARPIELVNLIADDIKLNHEVPHVHIKPRKGYSLKTTESERKLPLIGKALEAFKAYPNGFNIYRGNSDKLSVDINAYLTKNNLRPTEKHSLYSLRHSFQDRLNALELPDRIQCQLMGHKFHRPKYGSGATLEHLKSTMITLSLE
ncbi:MAG: DUF6538 domain-containing protein [Bacteroidota bacterium]